MKLKINELNDLMKKYEIVEHHYKIVIHGRRFRLHQWLENPK